MKSGFLKGYKTYILAAVAIIGAVAGYAIGEMSLQQALDYAWAGGVAATLRAAVKKAEV